MKSKDQNSKTGKELLILENIKSRRESLQFTQEYIARKLGITQNGYSKIERGITPLTTHHLMIIAKVLDCPASFLLDE